MRSSRERGGVQGHLQRQRPGGISPRKPPGRPGTEDVDLEWLQAMESVWPDWDPPPALHPDHPSAPLPRVDDALEGPPSGGQQWAAHLARGGHPQAVPTAPRRTDEYDYRSTRLEPSEEPGIPLWLAKRVLAEAGGEAAAIRAAAQREAAEIRQQAAAMRQQAAAIRQQAADEAAAIRAAAERDAAQMRAAVMTMSTELGDIAAHVTQSLTTPRKPANPANQGS